MPTATFIGRERELSQLQHWLDETNAGHGQVVFVAGEGGAGKSALLDEFMRRAEGANADSVAAVGQCNAHTGEGDAYLPFRQILTTLTGAEDEKQLARSDDPVNRARLREFARVSAETLVDVAPDLVSLFVPGASLLAKIVSKAVASSKVTDKLAEEAKGGGRDQHGALNPSALDQEKIVQQYTKALQALARNHTLILVLDDLQWADGASISLLFHLARELRDSRVLIVGAYRPGDVLLGRSGERHPFDPVLNELKRYYGDIVVDLDAALGREGHQFVDALIDAEPNRLDATFRSELFARTGGHPLFTIELLRNLQERGDLRKDAGGRWVASATLDWEVLPSRVEGVIAERIGRLSDDLRETLMAASVMGVDFTVQVLVQVQAVKEWDLVRSLTRESDKRHHLVKERGETRVGRQVLTWYRFTHLLVQQFLYDDLSAAERRLLHAAVAEALEGLYAEQLDLAAVQLARHYAAAGSDEKAIVYLLRAGDLAAEVYAQQEAIALYTQALELGARSKLSAEQRLHLYTRRGRAYELAGAYEAALRNYTEMESVAQAAGDRTLALHASMLRATLHTFDSPVMDWQAARDLSLQGLEIARELGDRQAETRIFWNLLLLERFSTGGLHDAIVHGEQSIALARELHLREQLALSLTDIVLPYCRNGQLQEAERSGEEAIVLWRELNNKPMLAEALASTHAAYLMRGRLERSLEVGEEAYALRQSLGDHYGLVSSAGALALSYREIGQLDRYFTLMAEVQQAAARFSRVMFAVFMLFSEAWDRAFLGHLATGRQLAQETMQQFAKDAPYMLPPWQTLLARIDLLAGDLPAAEAALDGVTLPPFAEALAASTWPQAVVTTVLAQAELALQSGNLRRAEELAADLAANLRHIGAVQFLPEALTVQAAALRSQRRDGEAMAVLQEARQAAEGMSSPYRLWPVLAASAELEAERGHQQQAEALQSQARTLVEALAQTLPEELRAGFLATEPVRKLHTS